MTALCGIPTTQYSAGSGPLSVHKLFTSCILRCLMSRACDLVMSALSAVLLIFTFQFSLLFFHISLAGQNSDVHALPNIGHRTLRKIWEVRFLYGAYSPGNNFELILMVKMETRHPVKGYFGSEFRAICNHCGVMTAWSGKRLKFVEQFFRFFWKNTPYGKIFKILFGKFSPPQALTDRRVVFKCRESVPTENRRNRELFRLTGQKYGCLSNCR